MIGALLGAIVFLIIFGYTPLIGANSGWLFGGDGSQYYLSAAFFQQSPWAFPPGLNSHYGLEIPSSIFLSDGIPLFGFLFKALYPITGHAVQYVGLWVLTCFVLQGLLGWLLAGLFTESNIIKLCTALLVLFMPAFLSRSVQLDHYPTAGHFLILAALVVFFSPVRRRRRAVWTGLVVLSVLCDSYIFTMVLAIWCADIAARAWRLEQKKRYLASEVVWVVSASAVTLWLSGFFVMGSGYEAVGFGVFRANLLSIFDSKPGYLSWSYFLPPTPKVSDANNAPHFLGTGLILVLAAAGLVCLERPSKPRWHSRVWFLVAAAVLMFLFAMSNRMSIGSFEFVIPIGTRMEGLASLFRASERFAWPLLYLSVAGAVHVLSTQLDRRFACAIFLAAAGLQSVDTRAGWGGVSERLAARKADSWPIALRAPFWGRAGTIYRDVRLLPAANFNPGYSDVAYFALQHGMRTDAVYLSRMDQARVDLENSRFVQDLKAGRLDPKTLYLLDDQYLDIASGVVKPDDLLERIDGHFVLAPGWRNVSGCGESQASSESSGCVQRHTLGAPIPLTELKWRSWGPGRNDASRAEVSSDELVDSALVTDISLPPASYVLTACMTWDVQGPSTGAADVCVLGKRKLINLQTSREDRACRSAGLDVGAGGSVVQIAFGLGGWSVGKGYIRLDSLSIRPLIAVK